MNRALSKAAALCAAAGMTAGLHAQDINWDNAAGGLWDDAINWNPAEVPSAPPEVAVIALPGAYDVLIRSLSPNVADLIISNPNAFVGLGNARDLRISGPMATINGTLAINDQGGTFASRLLINDPMCVLDGTGEIVLNDTSATAAGRAQFIDLVGGQLTTLGSGLTLRGSGQLSAALVNNGVVRADADGLWLNVFGGAKTNNNRYEATSNGILRLATPITQGDNGIIVADGGIVTLVSTIEGGEIDSRNGVFQIDNGNGVLDGVERVQGDIEIQNSRDLRIRDGLTLDGTIIVNRDSSTFATRLLFASSGTIDGDAEIVLNDSSTSAAGRAQLIDLVGGLETTLASTVLVRGSGQINAVLINNGTIRADADGLMLNIFGGSKINNGTLEVDNNGLLRFGTPIVQGADGKIVVIDGTARLNSTITGGEIDNQNGAFEIAVGNGVLEDVSRVTGDIEVENSRDLTVRGGLTMDGTITINREASTFATRLLLGTSGTLDGDLTIFLSDSSATAVGRAQLIDQVGGLTTTLADTVLVHGSGQINAVLINNGTIRADADGLDLRVLGSTKTNNNAFEAVDGGRMVLDTTIAQSASGRIVADGGTITLRSTISGGQIDSRTGVFQIVSGNGTLEDVDRVQGDIQIENSRDLAIRGDLTLDGTVVINRDGGTFSTRLLAATDGAIDGSGEIFLNDSLPTGTAGRAQFVHTVGGITTTLGPELSLTGNGNINGNYVLQGRVAPGKIGAGFGETGFLRLTGTTTMTDSTVVDIQLGGREAGEYDRIDGSAAITVDGTLDASIIDGFEAGVCENIVIISGASVTGEFDTFNPPAASSNRKWRLFYTGTSVDLRNTCLADIDGDCELTLFDFLAFQNLFDAGSVEADFDGDGSLTLFDFLAFQNAFDRGCD
ncbi:MAG: GC-type dockerin domain-anchored protein [Phycisphaerales bacterium JB064]